MPARGPRVADLRRAFWHLRHGGVDQLRRHLARRGAGGAPIGAVHVGRHGVEVRPWQLPDRPPVRAGLRVGAVLDDFSALAYRYEWDQVLLTPDEWPTQVREPRMIDLLFVESAWHGNGDAWQYHLTGPSAPRPAVVELVEWCRDQGVPTVFWNKEDPAHYGDFLDTARLFDHVFTTDERRLEDYRRDLGHDRVGVLPFAAQPAVHNPVRLASAEHQSRDVVFAGMYFAHRHPERREQMDLLLGAADRVSSRMDTGLEIYSRYLGHDDRYQFPPPFDSRVVGSLDYQRMLTATRAYKVVLNVNSVVDSPSMCARRIFEASASGTPVVSTPSEAIGRFFADDEVLQVGAARDAEWTIRALVNSPELRDRTVHLAQRRIWGEHTYGHRVDAVLSAAGLAAAPGRRPSVSALVSTNRPHQVEHVLRQLAAQQEVDLQVLVLGHGFELDDGVPALAAELGIADLVRLHAAASDPLGTCLNALVDAADGEVVAKIDDDDLYGPQYLSDQLYALDYSGAEVVGKQAHHMYLESLGATILRFPEREHRYTDLVMGPTIVTPRAVALASPFAEVTRGEDTGFLRRIVAEGGRVYSADRFGFVQVRRCAGGHTWGATTAELLASSRMVGYGRLESHVLV
ncbi:glycosyltransferase [Phycicoccus sp. CSK15P-2]|uniref:glycosyltransferase family protein n=1 Tax=Phycicoccus sp. CSK15P-2 TaxID=2807627 RepID=UPI0019527949|nr:glycosyltransferase [Phycicoccus sp. CSK15P-2]MBM6403510.1 glycosyltransferase [Phycicoccus sp. CSK15P-2]